MKINIAGVLKHSSVNGPGVRYVVFLQGCVHGCKGCQNPETHDPEGGQKTDTAIIAEDIAKTKYIDGITFSGGDPFFSPDETLDIIKKVREKKGKEINIWVYTGWTIEKILSGVLGKSSIEILKYVDVIVDGPFQEELKSDNCIYRGSSNQRLIDSKKTLESGEIRLFKV